MLGFNVALPRPGTGSRVITETSASPDGNGNLRRLPSQARSRARLERVLDATARLVDEHGPEAVTTGMIAATAEVSVGWLYDFFPNREAIFDALIERSIAAVTPLAERIHAEHASDEWRDALAAVVWALFDHYRSDPGFRVLWFSRFQSQAMIAANREHDLAEAAGAHRRLAGHGLRLVGVDPERALHLVVGIVDKGLDLAFRIDPDGDAEVVAETVIAASSYLERYHRP